jgi:serine/threonine-protein kinase
MHVGPGSQVGSLKIISLIGSGGMGEVYLAQDVRLGREVAVKILPETLADDPSRRSRFEREARVLASLNHPNIATLYGLSDIGRHVALEMEFVPGDTLADRLRRGPLRIDEALPIFKQLAHALEAAHERGVIHRDLKPANIKVPADGRVKVLDFGLAKALDVDDDEHNRANAAAFTVASSHTQPGMILGTARYMSPEQARGLPVDRRSDIWSFGCVLYESLSGAPPFVADTASDTLAAILKDEPDWSAVAGSPPLQRLVRRCLQKDPQSRLRDIADARLEIEELLLETSAGRPIAAIRPSRPRWRRVAAIWAAAAVVVVALGGSALWWTWPRPSPPAPARVSILLPPDQRLVIGPSPVLALSPNGEQLVYAAARPGQLAQLYVRPLDRFDAAAIPGTEAASAPFFSPDGRWVGFYARDGIQKVSLDGGAPLRICDAPPISGAAWLGDGTIVFGTTLDGDGLWRASADGGAAVRLTAPDTSKGEMQHRHPLVMSSAETLAFTVVTTDGAEGAVLTLATREWRRLPQVQPAGGIQLASSGHLVVAQSGSIVALPFDATRGLVSGSPVPLSERTITVADGGTAFALAQSGTLAYVPGRVAAPLRSLMLVDRTGRATPLGQAGAAFLQPRFSRDGRWLAVTIETENGTDVWLHDLQRATRTRLTTGGRAAFAVWSPDSGVVGFHAARQGPWSLYVRAVDGSAPAESLLSGSRPDAASVWSRDKSETLLPGFAPSLTGANPLYPASWSVDGRTVAFVERKPNAERDIWVVERGGDPVPFLLTPADESSPEFSPDGRWLAYVSDEAGRNDVYVQPYPGPGGRWLLSTDGGSHPAWSRDGSEVYYLQDRHVMAVPFRAAPEPRPGLPRRLFEGAFEPSDIARNYDPAPDGEHFVMIRSDEREAPAQIHLVLNWTAEIAGRQRPR